jgi:hypothetical protein
VRAQEKEKKEERKIQGNARRIYCGMISQVKINKSVRKDAMILRMNF